MREDTMKRTTSPHQIGSMVIRSLAIVGIMLGVGETLMAQAGASGGVRNVVLVHGGFVDGSGWQGVYNALKKNGYMVSIVQNPTISLADDVAGTKRDLAAQKG